jgi:hypothetical protein
MRINILSHIKKIQETVNNKIKSSNFVFLVCIAIAIGIAWGLAGLFYVLDGAKEEAINLSTYRFLSDDLRSMDALFRESSVSVETQTGTRFSYTEEYGIAFSFDDGRSWILRNQGLPVQRIYPFHDTKVKRITSIAIDPKFENRVAVSTLYGVFVSSDYGANWTEIALGSPISKNDLFMSVALCPDDENRILVGTSFSGLYETTDFGKTWTCPSDYVKELYMGGGFYQTISAVAYVPGNPNLCVICTAFSDDLYLFDIKGCKVTKMKSPANDSKTDKILSLAYQWSGVGMPALDITGNESKVRSGNTYTPQITYELFAKTQNAGYIYDPGVMEWRAVSHTVPRVPVVDDEKAKRMARASGKRGIYLSAYHAGSEERLSGHIAFMKEKGFDSVVIEMKDDLGFVAYDSGLAEVNATGALDKRMNIKKTIETLHANNIYCIARIVTFKDSTLYKYEDYKYAVWSKISARPWTNGKEDWVDPFSDFVWAYNIAIARELEKAGVDEIQFDYIRFPTDGAIRDIVYRYNTENQTMVEAIASFLVKARESISIPIGIDVYGYNGWFDMGTNMGQNIEALSEYADVISPMFYPSHFSSGFYNKIPYLDRAKVIYKEGSDRAYEIIGGRSLIRPYVQAFLLGDEKLLSDADQEKYLVNQIVGTEESDANGYTLWNSANNYYMVKNRVTK